MVYCIYTLNWSNSSFSERFEHSQRLITWKINILQNVIQTLLAWTPCVVIRYYHAEIKLTGSAVLKRKKDYDVGWPYQGLTEEEKVNFQK